MAARKIKAKVTPKSKKSNKTPRWTQLNQKKMMIIVAIIFGFVGLATLIKSFAATPMWLPTADKPLTLGWVLDTVNTADGLQTKNLAGQTIPEADVYDLDGETTPKSVVDGLHAKGKKVICYIDAGVWEPYRSDAGRFPGSQNYGVAYTGDPKYANENVIGAIDQGWGSDRWLDIRKIDMIKPIMLDRMQNWCVAKGFDSIEPDEITNYSNVSGFPLTYEDQIAYNKAVASWAHGLGLSIGLKGDIEQAADLVDDFDWSLNEECFMYNECTEYNLQSFTNKNKAVWVAEYPSEYPSAKRDSTTSSRLTASTYNAICTTSATYKFNTAFYILSLTTNGGRTDCPPYASTTGSGTITPPPTATNPTVTLVTSSSNLTAPATFNVTSNSSLAGNIDISLNGNIVKTCTNVTGCVFSASNYTAGTYTFSAKSTTSSGGTGTASITVTVASGSTGTAPTNVKPTVSLSASSTSLVAPATVSLSATAGDSDGSIAKVQFFSNGTQVGSNLSVAPYTLSLANTVAGSYTFSAVATDNQGATSTSNTVTVNVAQAPVTASMAPVWPSGAVIKADFHSLTSRTKCTTASTCKVDIWWPKATDDVGITGYEVWQAVGNNPLVKITTNTPGDQYYTQNLSKSSTYTYKIIAKDGSGNRTSGPSRTVRISCTLGVCSISN